MHTSVAVSETNSNKNDIQIKNNTQPNGLCVAFCLTRQLSSTL